MNKVYLTQEPKVWLVSHCRKTKTVIAKGRRRKLGYAKMNVVFSVVILFIFNCSDRQFKIQPFVRDQYWFLSSILILFILVCKKSYKFDSFNYRLRFIIHPKFMCAQWKRRYWGKKRPEWPSPCQRHFLARLFSKFLMYFPSPLRIGNSQPNQPPHTRIAAQASYVHYTTRLPPLLFLTNFPVRRSPWHSCPHVPSKSFRARIPGSRSKSFRARIPGFPVPDPSLSGPVFPVSRFPIQVFPGPLSPVVCSQPVSVQACLSSRLPFPRFFLITSTLTRHQAALHSSP